MHQITISQITYIRMMRHKWTPPVYTKNVIKNTNGTVSMVATDEMYESLKLLDDNIEQSIINIINSLERNPHV